MLLLLLLIILVVAFVIAKQQPESAAGKRIRNVYAAVGVAKVVDKGKSVAKGMKAKVIKDKSEGPEVVKAEVVVVKDEPKVVKDGAKPKAKKTTAKKASTKKTTAKKASTKKGGEKTVADD